MADYETILFEVMGRVGKITLNRPERLNAINVRLGHELLDALAYVYGRLSVLVDDAHRQLGLPIPTTMIVHGKEMGDLTDAFRVALQS